MGPRAFTDLNDSTASRRENSREVQTGVAATSPARARLPTGRSSFSALNSATPMTKDTAWNHPSPGSSASTAAATTGLPMSARTPSLMTPTGAANTAWTEKSRATATALSLATADWRSTTRATTPQIATSATAATELPARRSGLFRPMPSMSVLPPSNGRRKPSSSGGHQMFDEIPEWQTNNFYPPLSTKVSDYMQQVCKFFVDQYYYMLYTNPEEVFRFYHDSSWLSRPAPNGTMRSVTTLQRIAEKILSFHHECMSTETEIEDVQELPEGEIRIQVTGCLVRYDYSTRHFAQSFVLAPQVGGGYFVSRDVFCYHAMLKGYSTNGCLGEVEEAVSALQQTNPSVQRTVVSLSSDKVVGDAVVQNETIKELKVDLDFLEAAEDLQEKELGDDHHMDDDGDYHMEEEKAPWSNEVPTDSMKEVQSHLQSLEWNQNLKTEEVPTPQEIEEPVADTVNKKCHLTDVFLGHVDAGKSISSGQITFLRDQVDARVIQQYETEATEKNRARWYLTYIMDINKEKRVQGKTVEVGRANVETAQKGEFEAGMVRGGQTCEHVQLATTLGVSKLIVVVINMDDPTRAKARYDEIVLKMVPLLKISVYNMEKAVQFLPISALLGTIMKSRMDMIFVVLAQGLIAEGISNPELVRLFMMELTNWKTSWDCEILIAIYFASLLPSALVTLWGHAYGAQQHPKVGFPMLRAIVSLVWVCLPLSLIWVSVGSLLFFIGQDSEILMDAWKFAVGLLLVLFAYAVLVSLMKFFLSQSFIRTMLLSPLVILCVHIPLCWPLVYKSGLGNIGAPMSISFSNWLKVLIMEFPVWCSPSCQRTRVLFFKEVGYGMGDFFQLAIPTAVWICLEWWSVALLIRLSGLLSNPKLEASLLSACLPTISLLSTLPSSFGTTARIRFANELGASNLHAARTVVSVLVCLADLALKCHQRETDILEKQLQLIIIRWSEAIYGDDGFQNTHHWQQYASATFRIAQVVECFVPWPP